MSTKQYISLKLWTFRFVDGTQVKRSALLASLSGNLKGSEKIHWLTVDVTGQVDYWAAGN